VITIVLAACSLHTIASPVDLGLRINRPTPACVRMAAELSRYYHIETPGVPSAMFDLYWTLGTLRSGAVVCRATRARDGWRITIATERSTLGATYGEQVCSDLHGVGFSVAYRHA